MNGRTVNARPYPASLKYLFDEASPGLSGTADSLGHRIAEIERHNHAGASWFGAAATPAGTTNAGDRIGTIGTAYQLDAGNNTWGSWLLILGSEDTPARTGMAYFDPHQVLISATERIATYFIQFARGASGDAGVTAGNYTEFVIGSDTNRFKTITEIQTGRAPAGSLIWARCMCPGQDTATLDFYIGIHEYSG